MRMLERAFAASFRQHFSDLLGKRLVVAVSGGADSTTLTFLAHRTCHELEISLVLAHVHHGWRGGEADADAAFCQSLGEQLQVPVVLEKLQPPPPGVSREAWWREQRYRVLEEVRLGTGAAAVATAHTLDDQAETVLLKLLRGSGPRGVAGVRRRFGHVIRPLLDFRRQQLRDYLANLGQPFREDSTNLMTDRPRTFLRWQVLPILERAFGRALEHLATFGWELEEDNTLLEEAMLRRVPILRLGSPVALESVAALPGPLQRRWLQAVAATLPLAEPPSHQQLALFSQLLAGGAPRALDLGKRWVVARDRDWLVLYPPPLRPFPPFEITVPGVYHLPGGFTLGLDTRLGRPAFRVFLDPRVRDLRLTVESLPSGFRFAGREVRAALAGQGVPRQWRTAWPVLAVGGTIIWVPGVGVLPPWAQASGVLVEVEEPWERHGKSSLPRP